MKKSFFELSNASIADPRFEKDITDQKFFDYPIDPIISAEETLQATDKRSVAYFSMEFALAPSIYNKFSTHNSVATVNRMKKHEIFSNLKDMDYYHNFHFEELLDLPIYSGGLGVLAGDALKSCADRALSVVGVGILWNKGYFKQNFWFQYGQVPEETKWDPKSYPGLIPLDKTFTINIIGQDIKVKLWKYYVFSVDHKKVVPLLLMDTSDESNGPVARSLTDQLYRADNNFIKIAQRALLGIGGVKALKEVGYSIDKYHLNEGHAALAYVELFKELRDKEKVKEKLAYTCHTPVEAGHDRFHRREMEKVLSNEEIAIIQETQGMEGDNVNFTKLAMETAASANAVAQKHGEVTRLQFPEFRDKIKSITNGVHTYTWISSSIADLFDKYKGQIGDWRKDPDTLAKVKGLIGNNNFKYDLWNAHQINKKHFCNILKPWLLDANVFTVCWARRIAPYKRPSLILHNLQKIIDVAKTIGPIQIILAGKAHPSDNMGSTHINEIMTKIDELGSSRDLIKVLFLENYDTYIAKILVSSVDVWLNNPLPPFEASGTSGMKAILNGVPQLSTLDGWVVEAKDMEIGRIFGYVPPEGYIGSEDDRKLDEDSDELYKSLEEMGALYYRTIYEKDFFYKSTWLEMMINSIAAAGFFNTGRMIREYNNSAWGL